MEINNSNTFYKNLNKESNILQSIIKSNWDKALSNLHTVNFPLTKSEHWKYTRLHKLVQHSFYNNQAVPETFNLPKITDIQTRLVFLNGYFQKEISTIPNSEEIQIISTASDKAKIILSEYVQETGRQDYEIFSTINTVFATDGVLVHISKNKTLEPIHILNITHGDMSSSSLRNVILLEENAHAQIVFETLQSSDITSFQNSVHEIYLSKHASLKWQSLQRSFNHAFTIETCKVNQQNDSVFNSWYVSKGSAITRNNLMIELNGEFAEANLYGLTLGKNKDHIDHHTYIKHEKPNCNSNETYKGVFNDAATGVFNGKIFVQKDAQKTNAFQSSKNIVLSDHANAYSKPELEIYADDVKCSHGSTVGQLDDEAKFYLKARGIGDTLAEKLLVQAFAQDITNSITHDGTKEHIIQYFIDEFFQ